MIGRLTPGNRFPLNVPSVHPSWLLSIATMSVVLSGNRIALLISITSMALRSTVVVMDRSIRAEVRLTPFKMTVLLSVVETILGKTGCFLLITFVTSVALILGMMVMPFPVLTWVRLSTSAVLLSLLIWKNVWSVLSVCLGSLALTRTGSRAVSVLVIVEMVVGGQIGSSRLGLVGTASLTSPLGPSRVLAETELKDRRSERQGSTLCGAVVEMTFRRSSLR